MNNTAGGCGAAIGSITQAMKAQRVLAGAAIPTTVIKYEGESARVGKGCIYGVIFSCAQKVNVRTVLEAEKIKVRQWMNR